MPKICKENAEAVSINPERLLARLQSLAQIGRNKEGGIDRQLAAPADSAARVWLTGCWQKELGLEVRTDAIANLWGALKSGAKGMRPIVVGSHHDTVPNGGKFDGALGVIMATEIMQTVAESGVIMRHPLQIVSFTGEEPNPFAVSTLGSKVLSGRLTAGDLAKIYNKDTGEPLAAAITRLGGDIKRADEARLPKDSLAAFLECHIEQGRRLYTSNLSVASVQCITGIYRERLTIVGEANHAGTTRIFDRKDALAAASKLCLAVENIMRLPAMDDVAATVGRIDVAPNSSNIIPGKVELTLDLRTADPEKRKRALAFLSEAINEICRQREVQVERLVELDQPEMPMDDEVTEALAATMESVGEPRTSLISMAGHDAANMARITKAGMLFVQSIDGFSHCPLEMTGDGDIVKAGEVLLKAVLLLDGRMN